MAIGEASRVRVRMYRVGFGDCFLVSVPGPRHILIDCGSLAGEDDRLSAVVEDVIEETGGHVNVVVMSHRHRDHVSGFSSYAGLWNRVRVDEVWMPWTEERNSDLAFSLRHRFDEVAERLASMVEEPAVRRLAENSESDEGAFDVLLYGFAGHPKRRFLSGADGQIVSSALPGVHVTVVGPPKTPEYIQRLEVECSIAGLSAADPASFGPALAERYGPFSEQWRLSRGHAQKLFARELKRKSAWLESGSTDSLEALCYVLDKTINNMSLVLLLRVGRARLLFPGDASGEAWLPFIDTIALREELARLDLYKVSHHGSHNGTPGAIREWMARGGDDPLYSMVSTESEPWEHIPRVGLLRQLHRHGPVARTDRRRAPGFTKSELAIDLEIPV